MSEALSPDKEVLVAIVGRPIPKPNTFLSKDSELKTMGRVFADVKTTDEVLAMLGG